MLCVKLSGVTSYGTVGACVSVGACGRMGRRVVMMMVSGPKNVCICVSFKCHFAFGPLKMCVCVCVCVCERERERDRGTIVRVYVKQDDGIAADEGHAPGIMGQILLEVRGIKALERRCLFFYCCNIH